MRFRRAIFLIHLTTGCVTAAVIFFLAGTGFLLAWQKPIVRWQERGYRSAPAQAGTARLPLDGLAEIAAAREGRKATSITVDADPADPVEVDFGRERRLFLNGYSGAVLGEGAVRTRDFFTEVTALHRYFGTPLEDHASAKLVKGGFTLALLLMIVSGAWLWMPRSWSRRRLQAGLLPRFRLTGRARDWNWHNVVGFWTALPLAVIALTGAIMAYGWMTRLIYLATGSPEPAAVHQTEDSAHPMRGSAQSARHKKKKSSEKASGETAGETMGDALSVQQVFDRTAAQAAGWRQIRIALPRAGERTIDASVDLGDGGRPDQQAQMVYDRRTGTVVGLTTFSSFSLGRQIRAFMKGIHTGEAGGVAGETAAGLTSLACCLLVWTGMAMALRRLQALLAARRRTEQNPGAGAEPALIVPSD